jgi:hypothetical protein
MPWDTTISHSSIDISGEFIRNPPDNTGRRSGSKNSAGFGKKNKREYKRGAMVMIKDFFKNSALAEMITLKTELVFGRKTMNPRNLDKSLASGEVRFSPDDTGLIELEVNGLSVARGKIVRKWGRDYFKVMETADSRQEENI